MRSLASAGTFAAAVAATMLLAPAAHATPPGDNGTVKIHDAKTGEELRKNEPHVCTFYLDAFGFDGGQNVDWRIEAWAPTAGVKGEVVKTGSLKLDAEGHGRTPDQSLPDGHYKLFWNFDGEHGRAKHKVFWTDCDGEKPGGGKPTPSTGESTPGTPSSAPSSPSAPSSGPAKPSGEPTPSTPGGTVPTPQSSISSPPASATPSPTSSEPTKGDLAETGTGAPVGLLSAAAAALVAAGAYLALRRRKAQQH